MAIIKTDNENYGAIAGAIRDKNGEETLYKPEEMAAAIEAISGGGSNNPGVTYTENTASILPVMTSATAQGETICGLSGLDISGDITIGDDVRRICMFTFRDTKADQVIIPGTVTTFDLYIFEKTKIKKIIIAPGPKYSPPSVQTFLWQKDNSKNADLIIRRDIFRTTTTFGNSSDFSYYKDVVFDYPSSTGTISGCRQLNATKIIITDNCDATAIGASAFLTCTFTSAAIGKNIKSIANSSFRRTSSNSDTRQIFIPKTVETISADPSSTSKCPFYNHKGLTVYTDAASAAETPGWATGWNTIATSGTTLAPIVYNTTRAQFDAMFGTGGYD